MTFLGAVVLGFVAPIIFYAVLITLTDSWKRGTTAKKAANRAKAEYFRKVGFPKE